VASTLALKVVLCAPPRLGGAWCEPLENGVFQLGLMAANSVHERIYGLGAQVPSPHQPDANTEWQHGSQLLYARTTVRSERKPAVSRSDIRLIQYLDSSAHGLVWRWRLIGYFLILYYPNSQRRTTTRKYVNPGPHNTCLPRPEAPRHVSGGRSRDRKVCARTRYTHLDPGDGHPTPHTRTTLSRAGEQPTQLTQPCNYTMVHHYRYTHAHHFRYEHGDDSTPFAPR
jgi:hypothetical protein